jgi:hypothetical protein
MFLSRALGGIPDVSGTGSGGRGEISRILLGSIGRLGGERGHDDVAAPSGEAVRGALAVIHLMTVLAES